jgi:hypothetical protein
MAKSRFFRVAVEGATTDGRTIERRWLEQAAKNYDPATYSARVNMEHIRGYTGDAPFNTLGDVVAVKAEEIDFSLAGKTEKRLALFAQIEALDSLVELNSRKQKLFSSIEISPEFADSGEAYLVGLAVTDSPASLGTEMLAFAAGQGDQSPLAHRKQHPANLFTAAEEIALEIEPEIEASAETTPADPTGVFASLRAMIDRFTPAAPAPAIEPAPAADPAPAFAEALSQIASVIEASSAALSARMDAIEGAAAVIEAEAEAAPVEPFTSREPATGGEVALRTDC